MVEDEVRDGEESRVKEVLCWSIGDDDTLKLLPLEGSLIPTGTGFGLGLAVDSVSVLDTAGLVSCINSAGSV